jgi:hypothetical protein
MNLIIALPGPRLPDTHAGGEAPGGALPDMPALSRLLRRAQRLPAAPDWRSGVLAALAGSPVEAAQLAARAVPALSESMPLCLAAPLHVEAGISRVHLPPGGRLALEPVEEQAWCAAFNQEFGAQGVTLHVAAAGGGWLLVAPFAAAASDPAPEALVGEALARAPARNAEERSLRRLGAEVEMWLAAHELNREREARRLPPLNAIWFWGGARVAALPALRLPGVICSSGVADAWLAGLARHGAICLQRTSDWHAAQRCIAQAAGGAAPGGAVQQDRCAGLIVLAPDASGQSRAYWEALEANWFAPAERALGSGEVSGLRLQVGRSAWHRPARTAWRWPRWNRGHWWQLTGQVPA